MIVGHYAGIGNVPSTRENVLLAVRTAVVLVLIRHHVLRAAVLEQLYNQVVQAVQVGHRGTVAETVNRHAGMEE
jgi:hypothetical protein